MVGVAHIIKALVALGTGAVFIFTVLWYGWLEPPFLSFRNLPFPTVRDEYKAGEPMLLIVTRCNASDEEESYLISRRLIRLDQPPEGQRPIILPPGLVDLDPGCKEEQSGATVSPPSTPPGVYFIRGRAKVDGLWRTSYVPWSSQQFRITAP